MASSAAKDKLTKILAFTTVERGGNEVICTRSTWDSHVSVDHPEMAGLQGEVERALVDPSSIYPSTLSPNALVYEATTQGGIEIRAVVAFDDIAQYGTGTTIGKMNTAFPVDRVIYDTPHIGVPIYTKGTATSSNQGKEGE